MPRTAFLEADEAPSGAPTITITPDGISTINGSDPLGKLLAPHLTPKGYHRLQLASGEGTKNKLVHVLVAEAFIGPAPADDHQINHKDGDKQNNRDSNLEWVTQSENMQHAYDNGLKHPSVKYLVYCVERDEATLGCNKMEEILRAHGCDSASAAAIWSCINGHSETHCGLHFEGYLIADARLWVPYASMNLLQKLEMLADWYAATKRMKSGDLLASIEKNAERFGYSGWEKLSLISTAIELGWIDGEAAGFSDVLDTDAGTAEPGPESE